MTAGSGPLLVVRELRYAYPGGPEVLAGVSLALAAGEKVALVGPNGAGKSTLLLCLAGLLDGRGEVEIDGLRLAPATARRVRRRLGLVFQDPDDQLFMPTLAEDVAFGPLQMGLPAAEVEARVAAALAAVGLAGLGGRAPYRLSGGEKRAASLATVLSMEPALLALDEPSSGLDPRGRRQLIRNLAADTRACLIATHDLELVLEVCPRLVLIDGGCVAADGPSRSLLADRELMEAHGLEVPLSLRMAGGGHGRVAGGRQG